MATSIPSLTPRACTDCTGYNCEVGDLLATLTLLKESYPMLVDLTAIDHGVEAAKRFEVVYHLFSHLNYNYCRVATFCESNEAPCVPSAVPLWAGANWHERECFDLMGIKFDGHPDLRRILLWAEYPYHPLRKDFPLAGIEVPLPAADVAAQTGAKVLPAPLMGGPFTAKQASTMSKREPRAKDESWNENKQK